MQPAAKTMSPKKRAPIPTGSNISHPPAKTDATCMTVKTHRKPEDFGLRKTEINEITPNTTIANKMAEAISARLSICEG